MPIRSEAASVAEEETGFWAGLSVRCRELPWDDLPPTEADVVRFYDPRPDLAQRARAWGYDLGSGDLADLARFAGALARSESDAWRDDDPHLATRALEERKYLVSDRILHWAVPYLDAVGRCYPDLREGAHQDRDDLLRVGEQMRCAPALVGREGVTAPGEDSFGPLDVPAGPEDHLLTVWSGLVVLRATLTSMLGRSVSDRRVEERWLAEFPFRADLVTVYDVTGRRWARLAEVYPGTAGLWLDLAERAHRTSTALTSSKFEI